MEKRDQEWPAFLWCVHEDGRAAWIPIDYLQKDGTKGRLLTNYDSTELDARVGEILTILKSTGGWLWCRNSAGKIGWIPEKNVEMGAGPTACCGLPV